MMDDDFYRGKLVLITAATKKAPEVVGQFDIPNNVIRTYRSDTMEVMEVRAPTAEEIQKLNAVVAQDATIASTRTAQETLRASVRALVTDIKLEQDRIQLTLDATNATINGNPAPYLKDCARAIKRLCSAAIDIAKLLDP